MSDGLPTKDVRYRLSKKVAQLTKVVVHLNTINENYSADKKRLVDSYEAEKETTRGAHAKEIKDIKEKANSKVGLLEKEVTAKECALQEIAAKSREKEEAALKQLESAQRYAKVRIEEVENVAKAKIKELESISEREKASHAQAIRDITQSLEKQSRQHQDNISALKMQITEEHNKRSLLLKEKMKSRHARKIERLESGHKLALVAAKNIASEREKTAIENAVATAQLECERRLSEMQSNMDVRCKSIRANVTETMGKEIISLQKDLENTKLKEHEIAGLKSTIDIHISNEKRLQSDMKRLQTSLDAMSLSNQTTIAELQNRNDLLVEDANHARGAFENGMKRIQGLEEENIGLKTLVDTIDKQKSSLASELKSSSDARDEERQLRFAQHEEKEARVKSLLATIDSLQSECDWAKNTNKGLVEKLSIAQYEITVLSKYKDCVFLALPELLRLKTELNECKRDVLDLNQLLSLYGDGLSKWKGYQLEETSKLKDRSRVFQHEVDRLSTVASENERIAVESKTAVTCLKKKIEYLQRTANDAALARTGERLSWEKAMEDAKAQHRKEKARLCCMAQDEQDILCNQIAELKDDMKKQGESLERKCQLTEMDWRRKIEDEQTISSRIKYESALEIQGLSLRVDALSETLEHKETECESLTKSIGLLREQHMLDKKEALGELESLSQRHELELEEAKLLCSRQIQQKNKEIEQTEQEKKISYNISRQQIDELKRCIASERVDRVSESRCVKSDLLELRALTRSQIESLNKEWESFCQETIKRKLLQMKQSHDASLKRQCEELELLQKARFEAEEELNRQIAIMTKEAQDAKSMLFSTIRENEVKLERQRRHLKEDHAAEMKALTHESEIQEKVLAGKIRDLTNEYKSLACANAKKVDVIIQKDKDMNRLKSEMSETEKSYEEKIKAIKIKAVRDIADMQSKETTKRGNLTEALKKKHEQEMSELQTTIHEVSQKLKEADERWDSRPSLPKDEALIHSLKDEVAELSVIEMQTREKMLYFKRELENQDTNFNIRFCNDEVAINSPLRVKDDNVSRQFRQGTATTRRRARGKASACTRKKKSNSKLPKINK